MLSQIIKYLKTNKEASASQIAVELKIDRQTVEAILEELIRKGRVIKYIYENSTCLCNCNCCGCTGMSCKAKEAYRLIQ
ncbi:MAG: Ferrous iron transport protein C [Spirochaetes bacterium ADurb.Bin218]|jgi:predicted transcriptional regulator|nr:winged helix-turn-helix transcriptional regulator [Spirochaetota bacterium]OQA98228.1 MAG: Ferrous iron transport protein C [Spirochaetes bacterium ADurb.Bin218]HOQ11062.1 FeoC-like transcriptional regulator [Spirochaetota bacterium]